MAERKPKNRDQVESSVEVDNYKVEMAARERFLEEIAQERFAAEQVAEQSAGDVAVGTALRAVDPVTFGYSPQIFGAASKVGAEAIEMLGGPQAKSYPEYRDRTVGLMESAKSQSPVLSGTADVAGFLASIYTGGKAAGLAGKGLEKAGRAAMSAPAIAEAVATAARAAGNLPGAAQAGRLASAMVPSGEGLVATTARGARVGAGAAALANPGDVEGVVDPLQLEERIASLGPGALMGSMVSAPFGLAAGTGKLANRVSGSGLPPLQQFQNEIELLGASARQNIPLTIGTTSSNPLTRGLEVVLSKNPATKQGMQVAGEQRQMYQAMQRAVLGGASKRAMQDKAFVGQSMREHLNKMVDRIYKPIEEKYSQILPELELAPVNEKTLDKSMDFYEQMIERTSSILRRGPEAEALKYWITQIRSSRNARELDNAQTGLYNLGEQFKANKIGIPRELMALMEGVERQKRRAVVEAALESQGGRQTAQLSLPGIKPTGRERESIGLAESLIKDLKATDKEYAKFIDSLENVGVQKGKITRGTFMTALERISDEDIYNKLSKVNDHRFWQRLHSDAPEVVELMQNRIMADLVEKAIPAGGDVADLSVQKFINAVDAFKTKSPTLYRVVFEPEGVKLKGQNVGQMLKDVGLISRRMPNIGDINPSQTSVAENMINTAKSFWSPRTQFDAAAMNWIYRNQLDPNQLGQIAGSAGRPVAIASGAKVPQMMNPRLAEGPKIEGYPQAYLRQVPEVEVPLLLEQISKDQGLRITEKAQYSNLVNKHRKIPQNYLVVPQ